MFGIRFRNHPDLRRIMMPDDWEGYPLRKDYPVTGPGLMSDTDHSRRHRSKRQRRPTRTPRRMTLNMGPQHPSTHGVLRLLLELDGETMLSCRPDIGYLHTGIEKEFEQKTYQQAVTLTDRIDYLAPLSNNLCYCLAAEKLLGTGNSAEGAVDARDADRADAAEQPPGVAGNARASTSAR